MLAKLTFLLLTAYALAVEPLTTAQQPLATSYRFGYNDGQSTRSETRDMTGTVLGSYSYVGPDGVVRTTQYTAGTDGFRVIPSNPVGTTTSTGNTAVTATTAQGVNTPTTATIPQTVYSYLPSVPTFNYNSILPVQTPIGYPYRTPTTQYTTGYQQGYPVASSYYPTGYQTPTTTRYSASYQHPTAQFYNSYQVPFQYATGYQTPTYYSAAYKVPTTQYSAEVKVPTTQYSAGQQVPVTTNTEYSTGFRQIYP